MTSNKKLKQIAMKTRTTANLRNQVEAPESPQLNQCRQILFAGAGIVLASVFYPLHYPWHLMAVAGSILFFVTSGIICIAFAAADDSSIRHLKDRLYRLKGERDKLIAAKRLATADDVVADAAHEAGIAQLKCEFDQLLIRQTRLLAGEQQMAQAQEMRKARMIAMADERHQGLLQMEELELKQVADTYGERIAELEAELKRLDDNQAAELQSELSILQAKASEEVLLGYLIKNSPIIGITAETREALAAAGMCSAFDISEAALAASGFGGPIARTLLAWRAYLYQQADIKKPMMLKPALRKKIKNKYGKPLLKLETEINEIHGKLRREPAEIKELYQIAATRLTAIESALAGGTLAITEAKSDLQLHICAVNQMCREVQERLEDLNKWKEKRLNSANNESARLDREIAQIQKEMEKIVLPSLLNYLALILGIRRNLLLI